MSAMQEAARARNLAKLVACVPVMSPGDGLTTADIWRRLDCWALPSVRKMLGELAAEGRVIREPGGDVVLWRRGAA